MSARSGQGGLSCSKRITTYCLRTALVLALRAGARAGVSNESLGKVAFEVG